ncbi:MAG: hypothetical protein AAB608_01380 [Patescibacteria group bacterium]
MASSLLMHELTNVLLALGSLTRDARAARLVQEPSQRLVVAVTAHAQSATHDSYALCAQVAHELLERITLCEASGFCTSVDASRYTRALLTLRVCALDLVPRAVQHKKHVPRVRARSIRPPIIVSGNGEQRYADVLHFIREHPNVALNEVIRAFPQHSRRTVQRAVQFLVSAHTIQRIVNGKSVLYASL